MSQHQIYLLEALKLAEVRRGFCAPNPAVGAVVVKDHKILATGYHIAPGLPHAEVDALNKLTDEETKNATLYVTLEPCCHYGKTPPCTDLIIQRKIKSVIYGLKDPNPIVAGKGEAQLHATGIHCEQYIIPELEKFYRSYVYWTVTKKPWLTAKLAISLDGKIAGPQGQPIAITGERSRQYTHEWRKKSDAILTTFRTIQKDNPQLNVRLNDEVIAKPIYVLDRYLEIKGSEKIFSTAAKVILFHGPQVDFKRVRQLENKGIACLSVSESINGLDLDEVLKLIGREGVQDLWVEAGGTLFNRLAQSSLLNQGLVYIAPKILGPEALAAFPTASNFLASAKTIRWYNRDPDVICEVEF